jgi:enamine deaminase RidA (YjgF/YER057c/UK114 family)
LPRKIDHGERQVLVGAQPARDQNGSAVGKDNMRAQIEQADKNIQACLDAARAKASDITMTRAYVTDPDAFNKNIDVLIRDLGPRSSASSVAMVPKLSAGPDFLVEIEAVATIN